MRFITVLLGSLACELAARAQPVLTPPPPISVTPPALQEFRASQLGEGETSETGSGIPLGGLPFQWGPVNVRPHAFATYLYSDGILSSPGHPQSTVTYQLSPGLQFTLGSHWVLDYTPTWSWYSDNHFRSSLDHNLLLQGWTLYEDWVFGLSQGVRISSAPLVQTGMQTDQQSYTTGLSASHRFNSKVSVDLSLNQDFESADQFSSYRQWSTMEYVNYQFWSRLSAGIGAGFGYSEPDAGPDMISESVQGRVSWQVADKTRVLVHGGLQDSQFLGTAGNSSLLNPVYGVMVEYQAFKHTSLSLSADRGVGVSMFQDQVSDTTSVTAGVGQQLFGKLLLSLGAEYSTVDYVASSTGRPGSPGYDYYAFRARLSCAILKRGSIAATFQHSENTSSGSGLGFASNQVGLELGYSF
jgi:hypothetical protein